MSATRASRTILIVEDEYLVARELKEIVREAGGSALGPFARLAPARQAARDATLAGAILDVTLGMESVFPLAEDLLERGVPFILQTGYGTSMLPDRFRGVPRIEKPFDIGEMRRLVTGMLEREAATSA